MKIKNHVLLDNVFIEALKFFTKQHIPITVTFMLDDCLEVMQKQLNHIDETTKELLKRYAYVNIDENNNPVSYELSKATPENQQSFMKERVDLLNLDLELPIENRLEISVEKLKNIDISVEYLAKLKILIDFKK